MAQDGTNERVLATYEKQRESGPSFPGPSITIIKNFKQVTDNALPGGSLATISPQVGLGPGAASIPPTSSEAC